MNFNRALLSTLFLFGAIIIQGCTGVPVKMGVSNNYDRDSYNFDQPEKVTASASGFQLLLFIPISINDRQSRAYAELEKQAGDGLIGDVRIQESWKYAFVGTIYKTTIEANIYPKEIPKQ